MDSTIQLKTMNCEITILIVGAPGVGKTRFLENIGANNNILSTENEGRTITIKFLESNEIPGDDIFNNIDATIIMFDFLNFEDSFEFAKNTFCALRDRFPIYFLGWKYGSAIKDFSPKTLNILVYKKWWDDISNHKEIDDTYVDGISDDVESKVVQTLIVATLNKIYG